MNVLGNDDCEGLASIFANAARCSQLIAAACFRHVKRFFKSDKATDSATDVKGATVSATQPQCYKSRFNEQNIAELHTAFLGNEPVHKLFCQQLFGDNFKYDDDIANTHTICAFANLHAVKTYTVQTVVSANAAAASTLAAAGSVAAVDPNNVSPAFCNAILY